MQRSTSQKILKVISIISVVGAIISIIGAILLLAGGIFYAQSGPEGAIEGMTAAEAGAAVGAVGFFTLIEGLICLLQGVLGLRAAKDSRKVMPVWIIAVIGLAAGIISLVMTVFRGGVDASQYGSLIGSVASSALMFWLANNIRKQNA